MLKSYRAAIVAVFVASLGDAAAAQDTKADWLKKPTANDLVSVWPRDALKAGIGGQAIVSCIATVQGTLRECKVLSETPEGMHFGAAALVLTQQFLMRPATKGGKPAESTVNIPINFTRPPLPAKRSTTGSRVRAERDPEPRGEMIATNLPWREAPSFSEVLAAYPQKARSEKVSGAAALDCRLTPEGRLSGCKLMRETPNGYGFADAARELAPRFLGPTKGPDGQPLERVRTHVTFAFTAEALEKSQPTIGKPRWIGLPNLEDFAAVLPAKAKDAGVYKARVVMNCAVALGGGLQDCRVKGEEPAGLGYGEAALTLSKSFFINTWTDEGLPTIGGRVEVPLRFDLTDVAGEAKPAS